MTETTQARVEGTLDPLLGNDGLPWPQTFDGQMWAKEFIRHVKDRPEIATDEGTMIAWFANAIMVGYDRACRSPEPDGSGCGCLHCTRESGRTVNGLPEEMTRMIVCPTCGNKRCPRASDHRNACTNSNEPGQPGSIYGPNKAFTEGKKV